jgi:hypothetical protein
VEGATVDLAVAPPAVDCEHRASQWTGTARRSAWIRERQARPQELPLLQRKLAQAPRELQRELCEIFGLEITYDHRDRTVRIRITLSEDQRRRKGREHTKTPPGQCV